MATQQAEHGMHLVDALRTMAEMRTTQIVVTSMGTAREWPRLSAHPLDFHYVPSSMGQAHVFALGLALARPEREVWAFVGDGSLLMNLGSLITVAASGATNLTVILLDNGVYEVTGGQRTAASPVGADFVGLARAAKWPLARSYDDIGTWRMEAASVLAETGPRFIRLKVKPEREDFSLQVPGPMQDRLPAFRTALDATDAESPG